VRRASGASEPRPSRAASEPRLHRRRSPRPSGRLPVSRPEFDALQGRVGLGEPDGDAAGRDARGRAGSAATAGPTNSRGRPEGFARPKCRASRREHVLPAKGWRCPVDARVRRRLRSEQELPQSGQLRARGRGRAGDLPAAPPRARGRAISFRVEGKPPGKTARLRGPQRPWQGDAVKRSVSRDAPATLQNAALRSHRRAVRGQM
jgi:hypothetical protein